MILRGSHSADSQGDRRAATILFAIVFLFSGLSPSGSSSDSRWTVDVAMSMWKHHNTNLDDYEPAIRANGFYAIECVDNAGNAAYGARDHCDGHWYDSYPIAVKVLTAPLIWIEVAGLNLSKPLFTNVHVAHPVIEGVLHADFQAAHPVIEMEAASILLAASTVIMYLIARRWLDTKGAAWLSLLFATSTSAYSVAGRGLWQHSPSMLLLTIIIYLLLRAEERPQLAAWAGLPVALSYAIRPTDSLFVMTFTAYVAVRHRRYLAGFLLAAAPVAAAFVWYNESLYHSIFSPYYRSSGERFGSGFPAKLAEALAGNLISPSRGLFIYTPVFVFAVWSMVRGKWKTPLAPWLAGLALAHWLAISALAPDWWAGMCYGPRFFTDITPIFVLFLIPCFECWGRLPIAFRKAFLALALVGFAMHLRGGWSVAVYRWSVDPVSVDTHPGRNWDWRDPPFLRH